MKDLPHINPAFVAVALFSIAGAFYLYRRTGDRGEIGGNAVKNASATLQLFIVNAALFPLFLAVNQWVRAGYDWLGIPALAADTWAHVPAPAIVLLGIVTVDFADYWNHRLMHTRWVFPVHAVHHSDSHVNGLTTYRVHVLEPMLMAASYVVLLSWLNLPVVEVAAVTVLIALHNAYVHVDFGWGHGRLEWLVASPRYHRWHHADAPEAYGKNLSNVIPLWDKLFGTYYNPGPCHAPMGALRDGVPDTSALRLLYHPFAQWRRMIGARRAPSGRIEAGPRAAIGLSEEHPRGARLR